MGKIVIPKHSADINEMNAVLKIHYEANSWVSSQEYTKKLKKMIGADQYPSSYPKKAHLEKELLKEELLRLEKACMRR